MGLKLGCSLSPITTPAATPSAKTSNSLTILAGPWGVTM